MYIKRSEGPCAVTLPDGTIMTRADLPDPDTPRWVASRKLAVVRAVTAGLITREEALRRYALSDEEFDHWCTAATRHGKMALKVTATKKYRQL